MEPARRRATVGPTIAVVVAVALAGLASGLAAATPAGASAHRQAAPGLAFTPPVVIVYGDSIVHAAGPALQQLLAPHGIALVDASVGGTAPCDALQFVPSDMQKYRPVLVVVAYVGNAFSPCINGTPDRDVIMRHYQDTQTLVNEVDRPVLFATPPGRIGQGPYTAYDVLVDLEARQFGARIAQTARVLLDPRLHSYEKTVPCTPVRTCTPVVVRGPDDYHLSPAGGYLYAQALSKAILADLASIRAGSTTSAAVR